jgi:hypothetical protein
MGEKIKTNAGNVLLCVIYQLNFTVCVYVTRILRYITLYIAFGIIRGRSWNVLPADMGVRPVLVFSGEPTLPILLHPEDRDIALPV